MVFGTGHGFGQEMPDKLIQFPETVFDSQICIDYPGCGIPKFSGIIWIAYRLYQRLRRFGNIILYLVLFVCSTLSAHLSACLCRFKVQFSLIFKMSQPAPPPILSIDCKTKFKAKLGIIHHPVSHPQLEQQLLHSQYRYHLSVTSVIPNDTVSRKNIIFILLDSWNPMDIPIQDHADLSGFATRSSVFTHHLSSSKR